MQISGFISRISDPKILLIFLCSYFNFLVFQYTTFPVFYHDSLYCAGCVSESVLSSTLISVTSNLGWSKVMLIFRFLRTFLRTTNTLHTQLLSVMFPVSPFISSTEIIIYVGRTESHEQQFIVNLI